MERSAVTLHFPNLDVLRLALTSGAIPGEVALTAANGAVDDAGKAWIESAARFSRDSLKALKKLDVQQADSPVPLEPLVCWLQLFPLHADKRTAAPGDKTPILFVLPEEQQLATVVSEVLRLGNDRQAFRWLQEGQAGLAL